MHVSTNFNVFSHQPSGVRKVERDRVFNASKTFLHQREARQSIFAWYYVGIVI